MGTESIGNAGDLSQQESLPPPPGVAGEIASYIYQQAPYPNEVIAIGATLGFLAGVCGTNFQTPKPNTGLNGYFIILAPTGSGKEAKDTGISSLVTAISIKEPNVRQFVDFTDMASGPALIKALAVNSCFVNVVGEWGDVFTELSKDKPDATHKSLARVMKMLYMKSSAGSIAGGITYSNTDNNVGILGPVGYSLLAETVPETFFEAITPKIMREGFMARMTVIEYRGKRPKANPNPLITPPDALVTRLAQLVGQANRGKIQVVQLDANAKQLLDNFKELSDKEMDNAPDESRSQVWNRGYLKALRNACLLAVADNPFFPTVNAAHAEWALWLTKRDSKMFLDRFNSGDVGDDDKARHDKLISILIEYIKKPPERYETLRNFSLVPDQYLLSRTQRVSAFTRHRSGSNDALRETIRALVTAGVLQHAPPDKVKEKVANAVGSHYWLSGVPGYQQAMTTAWEGVQAPWAGKTDQ